MGGRIPFPFASTEVLIMTVVSGMRCDAMRGYTLGSSKISRANLSRPYTSLLPPTSSSLFLPLPLPLPTNSIPSSSALSTLLGASASSIPLNTQ